MSLTVGVTIRGLPKKDQSFVELLLQKIAQEHSYRFSFGLDKARLDVSDGLQTLLTTWDTELLALLHAPAWEEYPLVSETNEEEAPDGWYPSFYSFLEQIAVQLLPTFGPPSIFFAIWLDVNERVRRESGSVEALIQRLKSSQGWKLRRYSPKTDSYWHDDEVPLLYDIVSIK